MGAYKTVCSQNTSTVTVASALDSVLDSVFVAVDEHVLLPFKSNTKGWRPFDQSHF
jgi:hypothetical protein